MKLDLLYEIDAPKPWDGPPPLRPAQGGAEGLPGRRGADQARRPRWASTPSGRWSTTSARAVRTAPAPEVLLGALSQVTERIRLGFGVTLTPFGFTHPARIAEKVAAVDILSNGRVEWGHGPLHPHGANRLRRRPGEVSRSSGRRPSRSSRRCGARSASPGTHTTFQFPERVVTPKPVQDPHPPCWMAATSDGSAEVAGENGLGLLSFSIMQPLERMAQQVEVYRKAAATAKPLTDVSTNKVAALHTGALRREHGGSRGQRQSGSPWPGGTSTSPNSPSSGSCRTSPRSERDATFPLMKPLMEGQIPLDTFHEADMLVVGGRRALRSRR